MGLVTEDLTSLLTGNTGQTEDEIAANPFRRNLVSAMTSDDSGWHHAVHRFRKWLRTTLAAHGGHGDGLTR
jgi:hypothetical protein